MIGTRPIWRLLTLGVLLLAVSAPPLRADTETLHARLEGPLESGMMAYLKRAIGEARERDARLVLELDTPGGDVELMWHMATAIHEAGKDGLLTVAWVNDRALSAGALLAMACERLYMRSHATIGAALPVQIGPGGLMPAAEDEEVREKLSSALRSEFRAIAADHGRPAVLAAAMVDPDLRVLRVRVDGETRLSSGMVWDDALERGDPVELVGTVVERGELFACTGSDAVSLGLADGLADSLEEVIQKTGGGPAATAIERRASEDLAGLLYAAGPLLLLLGIVLAWLELKAPGFGVPGVLSIVCFGVALFGRYLVGLADVPHLVLITIGVVLLAVELFVVPGTVWVGLLGGLLALAGVAWSLVASSAALEFELGRSILLDQAFRVAATAAVAAVVVWGLSRLLPRTPFYRRLALPGGEDGSAFGGGVPEGRGEHARAARIGAEGRALTVLRPVGKVVLDGAPGLEYEARSEGATIGAGTRVRVVEVPGTGRLVVAAADEGGEA